uniref:Uncharacterized protein n=1 Tax=Tanacetum cinerariifolium TaxID=118510 RepID=A0A6L2L6B4_TANCI|nr:hypothetical protein [Tanacetum cinerariifolium]
MVVVEEEEECGGVILSNLAKIEFLALDITGKNYLSWVLDAGIHLNVNGIEDTIKEGNKTSVQDKAKAMIFLIHHLHKALKTEYLIVKDPFMLWNNLKDRYDHKKCGSSFGRGNYRGVQFKNTSGHKKWQDKGKMVKNDGDGKAKGAIENGCYRVIVLIIRTVFGIDSLDVDPKDQNDTTHLNVSDFLINE